MELYQLRQLVAFAKYGTLSKAAEMVHTSQPALSRSMQNLEAELGVALFSRTKNHIALTEVGVLAAQHAHVVVSAHDDMIRAVREADRRLRSFSARSLRLRCGNWHRSHQKFLPVKQYRVIYRKQRKRLSADLMTEHTI